MRAKANGVFPRRSGRWDAFADVPLLGEVVPELLQEAARFGLSQVALLGVVQQGDVLGPGEEPEEVVGVYGVLFAVSGQGEVAFYVVGDERVVGAPVREDAFVHSGDDQASEVQKARFQQSHQLQAFEGFAEEVDLLQGGSLAVETPQGGQVFHVRVAF